MRDFKQGVDTIELSSTSFAGLEPGKLEADAVVTVQTMRDQEQHIDRDTRLIFDLTGSKLYFDRDGSGDKYEPEMFAWLKDRPWVSDFLVV